MVAGVGKPDVTVGGRKFAFGPPPKYVWNQSVRNIVLQLDLEPVVPGLADIRSNIARALIEGTYSPDNIFGVPSVNAQIASDLAEQTRIDEVRRRLPRCA